MSLYLDSAATTPLHPEVQKAMNDIQDIFGNSGSKHFEGFRAKELIDTALQRIADILKVKKEQIIPTYGGTDANRRVIWNFQKQGLGDQIWCSSVEHGSIFDEFPETHRFNPFTFGGITGNPVLLALMHANNETGVIFDVPALKKKYPQALIFSDWVQGAGKIPFEFRDCDFASFSAHKIYGPKTVGLLYIKDPSLFPHIAQDTHTQNIQLVVGMAKAFELLSPKITEKLKTQTKTIEDFIHKTFQDYKIIHEDKKKVPGIINIAFKGIRGSELMAQLSSEERICVSTGSACSSDIFTVTPSIALFESNPDYHFPIRISLHQFITDEEITEFCEILEHYVESSRKSNLY